MLRKLTRGLIWTTETVAMAPLVLFILIVWGLSSVTRAWERFTLWAIWDGDAGARSKARWKNS